MRGVYILWYRDLLRFYRDRSRFFGSLAFPVLFLVIFGLGFSGGIGRLAPGVNYSVFLFPGIIGMTVLMNSFMAGLGLVWDREFGFLKEVMVAPVSRTAIAAGKTLGGSTVAVIQGVLILILAPAVGVRPSPLQVLSLLPVMFLLAASLSSLGVFFASRIRSLEGFQAVMQLLVFPMVFLSGVFFPLEGLPVWLGFLVRINPATYGVDAIRRLLVEPGEAGFSLGVSLFGHQVSFWEDILFVAAFGLLMMALAVWSFNRQEY